MLYQNLRLPVTKRVKDSKTKTAIPGRLITPNKKSNILLLVSTGLFGEHAHFFEYFGKPLGEEFNVYITEQRNHGLEFGETLRYDLYQIDQQIREITKANNVFYIGHSMGAIIAKKSLETFGQKVCGFYGICTYPSVGDTTNLEAKSLRHRVVDLISSAEIGPLAFFTRGSPLITPTKIAIGDNDARLNTFKPEVLSRIQAKFQSYGAQTEIFQGRNHGFNYDRYDEHPFNKDNSDVLLNNIRQFVYETLK